MDEKYCLSPGFKLFVSLKSRQLKLDKMQSISDLSYPLTIFSVAAF